MSRIALCEDDPTIRRVVREVMTREGHTVAMAHNATEALALFCHPGDFDALILDIGLPDADGRDLCLALRAAGQHAPVLFLTARADPEDVVAGFDAGGDDYLAKPFAIGELAARVSGLVRRAGPPRGVGGALLLDPVRHSARSDDAEVQLSPTEFRMLSALAAHAGSVVRRRDLAGATWARGAEVDDNTIDSNIRRLRRKLAGAGASVAISTVRGVGYRLT